MTQMKYKTPLSVIPAKAGIQSESIYMLRIRNFIRIIREVGEEPDCKNGGGRTELWSGDFSEEKYS